MLILLHYLSNLITFFQCLVRVPPLLGLWMVYWFLRSAISTSFLISIPSTLTKDLLFLYSSIWEFFRRLRDDYHGNLLLLLYGFSLLWVLGSWLDPRPKWSGPLLLSPDLGDLAIRVGDSPVISYILIPCLGGSFYNISLEILDIGRCRFLLRFNIIGCIIRPAGHPWVLLLPISDIHS